MKSVEIFYNKTAVKAANVSAILYGDRSYALLSVISSFDLKSIEIQKMPAIATRVYIILATIVVAPPPLSVRPLRLLPSK